MLWVDYYRSLQVTGRSQSASSTARLRQELWGCRGESSKYLQVALASALGRTAGQLVPSAVSVLLAVPSASAGTPAQLHLEYSHLVFTAHSYSTAQIEHACSES